MPNTVRLHRVLATKPDKVYRAFIEADAVARWLPPNGFTCTVHQLDAKVGGSHRMSFRNFTTGNSHSFGGQYLELVPGARLRYTDKFDDANLPGEMTVTVTLKAVAVGTEMTVVALSSFFVGKRASAHRPRTMCSVNASRASSFSASDSTRVPAPWMTTDR